MPSSKRASEVKRNDKKKVKVNGRYVENTMFSNMMRDCGVTLSDGSRANSIAAEQSVFLKKFHDAILNHDDYPAVVSEIFKGIEEYMEDGERFLRMMLTTDLLENAGDNDGLPAVPQDSVVRLLLRTQPLQTRLAEMLIGRMCDYESDPIHNLDNYTENPIHVLRLILNQLRWLDSMEDANAIALKLVNVASKMDGQIACSIVTSLPEIVGDEVDDNIVDKLKEFLGDDHDMMIPLLSTVGSLNCSPKAFSNFESTIFSLLRSPKLNEFPFIIKFLLQTMNADNAEANITGMRPHISFSLLSYSKDSVSSDQNVNDSTLGLLAENILHAAQYRSVVADAWIKILKDLNATNFTYNDFIIAVLFCSTYNTNLRKNAVMVLKTKVNEGVITDQLVQGAFLDCSSVLNKYFSKLSDLATQFLSSNAAPVQNFGGNLYMCMFAHLEPSFRGHVIKSLVQHVSTFCASEVDTALDSLLKIVSENAKLVLPYTNNLKDVMDHMERLTASQMRHIFEIMNRMCTVDESARSSELNEALSGVIRRFSTHSLTKFKCIGVIGAVGSLRVLGRQDTCNDKNYKKIKSTLNFVQGIIASDNRIGSYYFDELCNVSFDSMHPRLRNKLYSVIHKIISETFLLEHETDGGLPLKSVFGSQKDPESTISVYKSVQDCDFSHFLICPMFKALFKLVGDSQKEDVESLAQLPVQLHGSIFEPKEFKLQTPAEQTFAIDALFITINLFREQLNFLCRERSLFGRVLSRINAIIEIENNIESLLSSWSQKYIPPVMISEFANFNQHDATNVPNVTQTQASTVTSPTQSEKETGGVTKKSKTGKKKTEAGISIHSLKPHYFRELSTSMITVLEIAMAEDLFEEDVNVANSCDDVTLTASQALFLLRDLKRKVMHKLPARIAEKRSPFATTAVLQGFDDLDKVTESDFGNTVCNIITSLCNHLESVSGVYGEKRQEHLDSKNRHVLILCYEYILEVMLHTLSWRGLRSNPGLLRKLLFSIVRRLSPDLSEDSTLMNLTKGCMNYFKQFENTLVESSLQAAVFMMKLLHVIATFHDDKENCEHTVSLHEFSTQMLKTDWALCLDQTCPAAKKNDHLICLLKMNIQTSDDVMKCAAHFVDEGLCKLTSDDIIYPNFQKSNSHVLYCGLLETLADETCKIPAIKTKDAESTSIEILLKWNDCMKVIGVIVKLLREYHSRQNVLSSLKHGKLIIENFIKNGMPICEKLFHLYQDDIVSTLKHLQSSTRQFQHLTCHSKVTQDVVLAKQVPPLKKSLETLLFRVKAMLALHDCQEAFWLGNLKNRNLRGEEILSQLSQPGCSQDADTTCEYQEMSYSESY